MMKFIINNKQMHEKLTFLNTVIFDRLSQISKHLTISTIPTAITWIRQILSYPCYCCRKKEINKKDTGVVHLFSVSSLVSPLETDVLVEAPKQL